MQQNTYTYKYTNTLHIIDTPRADKDPTLDTDGKWKLIEQESV